MIKYRPLLGIQGGLGVKLAKKNVVYGVTINGIKEECTLGGVACPRHRMHSGMKSAVTAKAVSETIEKKPIRKSISEEWENADPSVLVSIGVCPCGEVEFYTHWKDAEYTRPGSCSDNCRSIADARNAWLGYYGYEEDIWEGTITKKSQDSEPKENN
jgi:hypothetical protein